MSTRANFAASCYAWSTKLTVKQRQTLIDKYGGYGYAIVAWHKLRMRAF